MKDTHHTPAGLHFRVLSDTQCAEMHSAAVRLLERTGAVYLDPEVLDLLQRAGARVMENNRVSLPRSLVEEAIQSAPSEVTVYNRHGEKAMVLGGRRSYYGGCSNLLMYRDPDTDESRKVVSADIDLMTRLLDALPHIDCTFVGGSVADYSSAYVPRAGIKHVLLNTCKPICFACNDREDLLEILSLAGLTVGGVEQIVEKPFIIQYSLAISPLTNDGPALRKIMACAESQIPLVYASAPQGGANAPTTPAGILVQGIAECLSGLVVHQLVRPGAPFIFGSIPGPFDMKALIFPYGTPDLHLILSALTDMAHFYRLPMFGTAGCTDAKEIDAQSGAEMAMSLLMAGLSGANLIHDVGLMSSAELLNPDALVLANEIIGMVKQIVRPLPTDSEAMALNVIEEATSHGSFLEHLHTLAHFRELWYPTVFDHSSLQGEGARKRSLREALREKTREILRSHTPAPLPEEVILKLETMVPRPSTPL